MERRVGEYRLNAFSITRGHSAHHPRTGLIKNPISGELATSTLVFTQADI